MYKSFKHTIEIELEITPTHYLPGSKSTSDDPGSGPEIEVNAEIIINSMITKKIPCPSEILCKYYDELCDAAIREIEQDISDAQTEYRELSRDEIRDMCLKEDR